MFSVQQVIDMKIKRRKEEYNLSKSWCVVVVIGGASAGALPKLGCSQGSEDVMHLILPLAECLYWSWMRVCRA